MKLELLLQHDYMTCYDLGCAICWELYGLPPQAKDDTQGAKMINVTEFSCDATILRHRIVEVICGNRIELTLSQMQELDTLCETALADFAHKLRLPPLRRKTNGGQR